MNFADLIREARIKKGWTQDQLAEAMDVSRGYIGQVETGLVRHPREKYLRLFEKHLNLTREQLLRAGGLLGAESKYDVMAEVRRIAAIDNLDQQEAELRQLPPELVQLMENMALQHVRRAFRRPPSREEVAPASDSV